MCTIISANRDGTAPEPKIAEKKIFVYKAGRYDRKDKIFFPFLKFFAYTKDEVNKTKFTFDNNNGNWFDDKEYNYLLRVQKPIYVARGFHALKKPEVDRLSVIRSVDSIGRFIIPEGAKYYDNPAGCIVSDTIIFDKLYKIIR